MHEIYPWQQHQWQYLITSHNNGNLPHSLLLAGQHGLGKTSFAFALAELLLCKQSDSKACAKKKCRSCSLMQAGNHPDFKLIEPEDKVIKIEQIREVVDTVNKKAHQNKGQVILINPAHAMNIAASNALLKTLEEPQGEVIIILITDRPSLLLPTIRSRCQRINFSAPKKEIAKNWLQQQIPAAENIDLLLSLAENAPLQALELAQDDDLKLREDLFKKFIYLIQKKLDPLQFAESCMKMDLAKVLNYLQIWLADIIKDKFLLNIDKKKLFKYIDKVTEFNKYIGNNLNKQLVLEDLALTLGGFLLDVS